MGRKPTGQTTTVIRVPKRFKKKVEDYINYLKQAEIPERDRICDALATVQQAGLIDLHGIAHTYGISVTDATGQYLPKETLRLKLIDFLSSKTR